MPLRPVPPAARVVLILGLAAPLVASPLAAQDSSASRGPRVSVAVHGDSVAHVVPRQSPRRAAFAIVSQDGASALLLMDTTIVAQLTDRGLDRTREAADSAARAGTDSSGGGGVLARMIAGAVVGALRPILDQGIAYHLRDLGEASVRPDGRLLLRRRSGEEIFANVEINGRPLMESFAPDDAREFARRAMAARHRLR